jgi:hypothetical protein
METSSRNGDYKRIEVLNARISYIRDKMGLENEDLYSVQTIIYYFLYFLKEMLAEYDVPCSNQYNIAVGAVSGYYQLGLYNNTYYSLSNTHLKKRSGRN